MHDPNCQCHALRFPVFVKSNNDTSLVTNREKNCTWQ